MDESLEKRMMARALELAARAGGRTSPNPMVGAVVFRGGRVIGEGWHHRCGTEHAERIALRKAGKQAAGAAMAVNLEPCAHHGRTPPCVEAIIQARIARVVVAMRDPNPLVRGRGLAALRGAGIRVEVGLMGAEARLLNEAFIHYITTGRSFAALKIAQSLDGGIALRPGLRTAVTSSHALRFTHTLRSRYDAVLVGISTVLADDPLLNVRGIRSAVQPVRIVLDSSLRMPPDCRLAVTAKDFPTLVLYDPHSAESSRIEALKARKVGLAPVEAAAESPGLLPPDEVLSILAGRELTSVLVEGGASVATSFLKQGFIQRIHLFIAPMLMGRGGPLHALGEIGVTERTGPVRLRNLERKLLGPDIYITGRVSGPKR
ncbi:MAG: bifunctional diaminohydroxyphosphoribosylaminopyrimidine deaminase/5-amino-6-(5-phosphoribosylamino)uracil reductase RibD [Gemmatimonadota bacterium]|nr:bifunctional diaminohydroxyphosphoribosylaminopyrimidine deaminase/5-amino-6-(5-phosphoribosylamino)uracil reductase RibD [Gemmatimonadota bacterium]